MSDADDRPRYAYENPADLAWTAQMVKTWAKRRRARLAAEQAAAEHSAPVYVAGQDHS